MIRLRFGRLLGFGLSLLAAGVSSLAGGALLIRCEEPDGCVQIELVARSSASSTACGGHEHEASIAPAGDALSHPCKDTVIASFSEEARPEKSVQVSSKYRNAAPPSFAILSFASAREAFAPARDIPRWCTHRVLVVPSSVVLRI